jgi:O-antigen/teichoic acid export membrane protein
MLSPLPERLDGRLLRIIAGVVIPGAVASVPWLLVVAQTYPAFGDWIFSGEILPNTTLVIVVFCAGMFLENFGSRLEVFFDRENKMNEAAWSRYLQQPQGELVGHGYISSVVTRFKFELGMIFALPIAALAAAVLAFCQNAMPQVPAAFFIPSALAATGYLFLEAKRGAQVLDKTRKIVASETDKPAHRLNETRCSVTASMIARPVAEEAEHKPESSR